MADDLPTEFELIVVGTGFIESVVAAAGSRIGKTVLHIDSNDFYGGIWASFNLRSIQSFVDSQSETRTSVNAGAIENGILLMNESNNTNLRNVEYEWHAECEPETLIVEEPVKQLAGNVTQDTAASSNSDTIIEPVIENTKPTDDPAPTTESKVTWTRERILNESRKFNIDLIPKLLFARGDLVELLISSNICRYAEFRSVDKVTTLIEGEVKAVPCSRSDVFTTKDVSVVEKRFLMKILQNCVNYEDGCEEFKDYQTRTFRDYLESKRITATLVHYILYAISMSDDSTSCIDGVIRTKKFLSSLGRYGNTPFLFPMYGCGEIPQCFCRLCAIFGGVYCLKREISEIHFDPANKFSAIKCNGQIITGKSIVLGSDFNLTESTFPASADKGAGIESCGHLARAIFITNKPIGNEAINAGGGGVNVLKLPSPAPKEGSDHSGAIVIQLAHFSGTCPKGLYLIHVITRAKNNPKIDIQPYREQLFSDNESSILWTMHFNIPACFKCSNPGKQLPANMHVSCGPMFELDYDQSIKQARDIFAQLYSDEEFLPRAPDPEDIIIEGQSTTDADNVDFASNASASDDNNIKDRIEKVADDIENDAKCIEENVQNETQ